MADWFADLWETLGGRPRRRGPLFHRRIRISGHVLEWIRAPERTERQKLDLADLLLRLDADPIACSDPLLGPDLPLGLRCANFGDHVALFILDPAQNRIKLLTCHPRNQNTESGAPDE